MAIRYSKQFLAKYGQYMRNQWLPHFLDWAIKSHRSYPVISSHLDIALTRISRIGLSCSLSPRFCLRSSSPLLSLSTGKTMWGQLLLGVIGGAGMGSTCMRGAPSRSIFIGLLDLIGSCRSCRTASCRYPRYSWTYGRYPWVGWLSRCRSFGRNRCIGYTSIGSPSSWGPV